MKPVFQNHSVLGPPQQAAIGRHIHSGETTGVKRNPGNSGLGSHSSHAAEALGKVRPCL